MSADSRQVGDEGEEAAAAYLRHRGYSIRGRNIRFPYGEIDILAEDPDGCLVVVEVKTQRSLAYKDPLLQVNPHKARTLWRLAQTVTLRYPSEDVRIDIVSVYQPSSFEECRITHYPNAIQF